MKLLRLALLVVAASAVATVDAQSPSSVDAAFQKFWDARSPSDAAKLVDPLLKGGAGEASVRDRLKEFAAAQGLPL